MASADAVVSQSLECSLCYELFSEPKILTCGHTFCKQCLVSLYECHPQRSKISCPICRQITEINNGLISKLQTNILINSMVDDMKSAEKKCNICDPVAKSRAVQYCAHCDEYMCDPCTVAHGRFKNNTKHDVVSVDDVKSGRVKVKRYCTKHPEEEKLYVCTSCNVSICFRCRVIDHSNTGHEIKEVADYKKTVQKKIETLQNRVESTIATIEAHKELVKEQRAVVEAEVDQMIAEINQSYEEAVDHLTRQRNDFINQCKKERDSHIARLEKIKEFDDKEMCCIRRASELVGNGIKALLEGETLAVHNTICCDLEDMLGKGVLDYVQPKLIADRAKQLQFIKSGIPYSLGDLRLPDWQIDNVIYASDDSITSLGDTRLADWQLKNVNTFHLTAREPRDAVVLPDGRVAVGYANRVHMMMFTANGPDQVTSIWAMNVQNVSVLSDGRYVVGDDKNNISLYTPAMEKLNVQFNTIPSNEGRIGGMCTDRDGNIYVGYNVYTDKGKQKIAVFRTEGGAPCREIQCNSRCWEIFHMNHSKRLVVSSWNNSIRVIDDMDREGTTLHHITVGSNQDSCRIALLKDDSILITNTNRNHVSMELYTKNLDKIRTVLEDFPLERSLHKMVALSSGQIVLVSWNRFFLFTKINTS